MGVQTVRGEIGVDDLGITLMHEHVWIDRYPVTEDYNLRLTDAPLVIRELAGFVEAGGRTLCDVTPPGIGRSPADLLHISRETGINIVMGSGWYLQPFHPDDVAEWSVSRLAAALTEEIEFGDPGSGIKPGIIGEIASGLTMSPAEERTLRAAARAQRASGLPLTTHAFGSPVSLHQLEVLQEEGADLSKCVIGHVDSVQDPDLHEFLAKSGVWVQFDLLRCQNEWETEQRAVLIEEVFRRGNADKLLLSHDACMKSHMRAYGGTGYTAIFDRLIPALQRHGIDEGEILHLLSENPRKVFAD